MGNFGGCMMRCKSWCNCRDCCDRCKICCKYYCCKCNCCKSNCCKSNCCSNLCTSCYESTSKKFTGYLHLTNDTSQKIVDAKVKIYNSRIINFDQKSFVEKLKTTGDSIRQDFGVLFEKLRSTKKKLDYQYQLTLMFADDTSDVVEFQQLAVLPKTTIEDVAGYKILRGDHAIKVVRDRQGRGFKVRLTNTRLQHWDKGAEAYLAQGDKDMEAELYDSALLNYRLAHKKAASGYTLRRAARGQAEAYTRIGLAQMQRAMLLEDGQAKEDVLEAQQLMVEAEKKLKAAQHLTGTWQCTQHLKSIELMGQGNRLFNEAADLENKAFDVLEQIKDVGLAGKTLCQALAKYEQSAAKFEEGLTYDQGKFREKKAIVEQQIAGVRQLVSGISGS